jgi:hypothetical protein
LKGPGGHKTKMNLPQLEDREEKEEEEEEEEEKTTRRRR